LLFVSQGLYFKHCLSIKNKYNFDFFSILTKYQSLNSSKKKKRGQRAVGGDKSGRGLRQFSMKGIIFVLISLFPLFIALVFPDKILQFLQVMKSFSKYFNAHT
jgi:hypothetical protein